MTSPGWPWLADEEPFPSLSGYRPVVGTGAMISTPHAAASDVGMEILRRGGNAVDAAIAASAALMVTCPMQCGPGGDAFWIISSPGAKARVLDASGRAPRAASIEAVNTAQLSGIPPRSAYSVTVPGAVAGWLDAHREYGTLALHELLEPAARLAEDGVAATRHVVASFRAAHQELTEKDAYCLWPDLNSPPNLYSCVRQPALAETLRSIGSGGGEAFYSGRMAAAIASAVSAREGWLTEDDLAAHNSEWVEPISGKFRGQEIMTTPPSTQGFCLPLALACVESVSESVLDPLAPATAHLLIEAAAYALSVRDERSMDRDLLSGSPGDLYGNEIIEKFRAYFDPTKRSVLARKPSARVTKGDTAHLAVVDHSGMAVSLTQSLYFDFGSCIPIPEGGFVLQNRGDGFHLRKGEVGELLGGRRPPSTLMPSMAFQDNRPSLVFGCMGGDGQMQTQLKFLVDVLDGGLDVQQAVSRKRWYLDRSNLEGAGVLIEKDVSDDIAEGLAEIGHAVRVLHPHEDVMGHFQAIDCREVGVLVGACDPRSDGQVLTSWRK